MHNKNKGAALAARAPRIAKNNPDPADGGLQLVLERRAMRFASARTRGSSGNPGLSLSYGFAQRLEPQDCHILGGDSGGCS